jgi:hypothetical protein
MHKASYHLAMRALLIAFMIVLLPIRSWMGDAMALGTPLPVQASATLAAAPQATPTPPCHDLTDPGVPGAHVTATAMNGQTGNGEDDLSHACNSCHGSCSVCHGMALAAPEPLPPGGPAPLSVPQAQFAADLTAHPTPLHKPPIG